MFDILRPLTVLVFILSCVFARQVSAQELVRLPIREMRELRTDHGMQLVVTVDFQACKYAYKGLYLEAIANGQGQARFRVTALASEQMKGSCSGQIVPRTDSVHLDPTANERYDFIPVQP